LAIRSAVASELSFAQPDSRKLPENARTLVLQSCIHDNDIKIHLHAAVVMPDHVHLVFTPTINAFASQVYSIAEIMDAIKGASAHKINQALGRRGKVWQTESFDRVLRSSENLDAKIAYILENPLRAGLVADWKHYPWLWYRGIENPYASKYGNQNSPTCA